LVPPLAGQNRREGRIVPDANVKSQQGVHYTIVAVVKSARSKRRLLTTDAERQNNQSRALNEQEHTEHDRDGEGCRDRRAEQQYSD
jgi:hypothetical protein